MLSDSVTARLAAVGILVVLLQLPILMIAGLVTERQARRDAAVADVSSKWGNTQTIAGPAIVLPYTRRSIETMANGQQVQRAESRSAVFLPNRLHVTAVADVATRSRGIFSVPVYTLKLTAEGEFTRIRPGDLGVPAADVSWDRAHVAVAISDVRAIQERTAITWNGAAAAFLPGVGGLVDAATGVHADVAIDEATPRYSFRFPLALNGSVGIFMAPFAQETIVELRSNSPHPNFQGAWLPAERSISANGFTARWSIPFLSRNYPQAWTSPASMKDAIQRSTFGVELMEPIDHYRMAARSVKYAAMFILLTFAVVWLIDVLNVRPIHPVQYLLLGAALCCFYLLELSLAEHLGFGAAYLIASAAVFGLVAAYSFAILRRAAPASAVGGAVAALYGYLYIVLTNEDFPARAERRPPRRRCRARNVQPIARAPARRRPRGFSVPHSSSTSRSGGAPLPRLRRSRGRTPPRSLWTAP